MFEIKYDSKKDLIEKAQVAKPTFSKRYVDNDFAGFESELDAEICYTYLNTKHKNINLHMKIKLKIIYLF